MSDAVASADVRVWPAAVVVFLALASLPATQAAVSAPVGSTPTTLYMHLLNFQDFPVNTQVPDERFVDAMAVGIATNTLTCIPNPPAGGQPFMEWHSWNGYSSPSYVEYDFEQDGRPRVHSQRGLSWNVTLDDGRPPMLHWYLVQDLGPADIASGPLPLANVVVEAFLREPDAISPDDHAYGTGPVVAHGRSAPALLAGSASQGAEPFDAGGRQGYGFAVPLTLEAASISRSTGYTIQVRAYIDNPVCGEGDVMPSQFAAYGDAAHWPRIELAARDVLRIEALEPQLVNGTVVLAARFNSVWGNYDVDEDNVTLTVNGPDGPVPVTLASFVQRTHEHYHAFDQVQAAWAADQSLADGLYRVDLTILNDQHTAAATAHAAFRLGPFVAYPAPDGGGPPGTAEATQAMPAPAPLMAAVLLFAGVALRRLFGNR